MKRTLAGWVKTKETLEKLEDSCLQDLKNAETSADERVEALSTLLAISREPFAGSDFPYRIVKKGILPLLPQCFDANRLNEVINAVELLRRIAAEDPSLCNEVINSGIVQLAVKVFDDIMVTRPESKESIVETSDAREVLRAQLNSEKVDNHEDEKRQYTDDGPITFQKSDSQEQKNDSNDEASDEPSDDSTRAMKLLLKFISIIASTYDGRQFLTTEGLTATLVQVLPREQPLIRKQTLGILLLLAEDVFTRSELRTLMCLSLGLGGLEAVKGRVLNTKDTEEIRWFGEICKHLELIANLKREGKAWYDPYEFPFAKMLEENYPVILEEFRQLEETHLVAWPEKFLCQKGWDVFPFFAFNNKMQKNCALCPKTTAILESIPGMVTAMFSCLQPRTHIKPHIGYQQYSERILRMHLGLIVPEGCYLKVNWETIAWEEGKTLCFDDTFRHEAWNSSTTQRRVVLMVDFYYEGKTSERNPDFVNQMLAEGVGSGKEALVSKDLMEAIKKFGEMQNIAEGRQENFQ